jgi:[protein-PII] uridylyltransferase
MAALFSRMNVDVRMARILTSDQRVSDVFHIEGPEGGKIEDREHLGELVSALEFALSEA